MASSLSLSEPSQDYLDQYIGYRLVNVGIAFMVLEPIFVALRLCSRRTQKAPQDWDDYLVPLALVFCILNSILAFGVGRHMEFVIQYPEKIAYWYKSSLIALPIMYAIAVSLPKCAILVVYLRIFVDKASRWCTYLVMVVIVSNATATIPACIWKCHPISHGWNPAASPNGWCDNIEALFRYGTLANIITDVAMLILPMPLIWKLRTNRATKVGLTVTFVIGSVGLITSILRLVAFFDTSALADETWNAVILITWCVVEPGTYLFASCFIAFHPLIAYIVHPTRLLNTFTRSHKTVSRNNGNGRSRSCMELQTGKDSRNTSSASDMKDNFLSATSNAKTAGRTERSEPTLLAPTLPQKIYANELLV
ncbi:hypothetical protein EV356DRAFT_565867 [Viridothelium virens]|uniref:Rhodopsin domain-containing protein n=1 Tax=Viridothelium virens TaxID=1048519 RepID=A0A6A6HDL2_VIRVR|nr:hypothetical protein EV356DRAFT_565867 [Viridothelium virens]